MNVLAVTPCRRGSKGLPGKNTSKLNGRPLVWYTLAATHESRRAIRHVVSVDDSSGFECVRELAELRQHPARLSRDGVSSFGVLQHVLKTLAAEDYHPDLVLLLRATSPLRTSADIDDSVALFSEVAQRGYDAVVGHCVVESGHPQRMRHFDGTQLRNLYDERENSLRQELRPKLLLRNEAIYVTTPDVIHRGSLWGDQPYPYIMPAHRSVNINTALDWALAETLLVSK